MQDHLSKYCLAEPIPDLKAVTIAEAVSRRLFAQFGAPRAILTDRGAAFTSDLFQEICEIFRVNQLTTSGYRPQTNGALERSHIVLVEYVKQYATEYDDWDRLLPFTEFSYNTCVHEATNFTPYEVVYGKLARLPSEFPVDNKLETYNSYTTAVIKRLSEIKAIVGDNLNRAKEKSKFYYDRKVRPFEGKIGDKVYVLKEPKKGKFDSQYHGPYKIVEISDRSNVILETINGQRIRKHVDKVKLAYE